MIFGQFSSSLGFYCDYSDYACLEKIPQVYLIIMHWARVTRAVELPDFPTATTMVGQIARLTGKVDHGHHHSVNGGFSGDWGFRGCLIGGQDLLFIQIDALVGLGSGGLVVGTGHSVEAVLQTGPGSRDLGELLLALELPFTPFLNRGYIVVEEEGTTGLLRGCSCGGGCGGTRGRIPMKNPAQNSSLNGGYQQSGQ